MKITLDTREPDPHPWAPFLPEGWTVTRAALETGDVALAALPEGTVIERKTASDLAGCIGQSRERFERELRRSRYCGRFLIVCEGSLSDLLAAAGGIHANAVIGTVAAWSARYCPILFAGSVRHAAALAFRALGVQVRDAERHHTALFKCRHHAPSNEKKTPLRDTQGAKTHKPTSSLDY